MKIAKLKPPKQGRCIECTYMKQCTASQGAYATLFGFNGCFHPPYQGKWVCEIEDCPKKGAER